MDPLRDQLLDLLHGGGAHVDFAAAVDGIPAEMRGKRPPASPHSCWELLEHIRIAQWDILEFTRNPEHKSPKWPDGYWPRSPEPPDSEAWQTAVRAFHADHDAMCQLISDPKTDLHARIPNGDGQTALREALLVADHNAYHIGQLVLIRKLLGAWK